MQYKSYTLPNKPENILNFWSIRVRMNPVFCAEILSGHFEMPSKAETPLTATYRPKLDMSPELGPDDAAYYQSLIGMLRGVVKLGWIDICLEVSMMSSHVAVHRKATSSRFSIYSCICGTITMQNLFMIQVTLS